MIFNNSGKSKNNIFYLISSLFIADDYFIIADE